MKKTVKQKKVASEEKEEVILKPVEHKLDESPVDIPEQKIEEKKIDENVDVVEEEVIKLQEPVPIEVASEEQVVRPELAKEILEEKQQIEEKPRAWRRGPQEKPKEEIRAPEAPEVKEDEKVPTERKTSITPKPELKPEEEIVPWNKQQIVLKKTVKDRKQLEEKGKEEVVLKPIIKPIDEVQEKPKHIEEEELVTEKKPEERIEQTSELVDEITEEVKVEKLEPKPWRKPRKPEESKKDEKPTGEIKPKEEIKLETEEVEESKPQEIVEEMKPTEIIEEIKTTEKVTEDISVPRKKKVPREKLEKVEVLPWNQEQITLKKTVKAKPTPVKAELEEVTLKPVQKPEEEKPELDKEEISSEETEVEKDVTKSKKKKHKKRPKAKISEEKPDIEQTLAKPQEKQEDVKPLSESVIVETVTEIEDTIVLKVDEETDKPKPKLARAFDIEEEKIEQIKLKPTPVKQKPIEKEEIETVTLKPVKKPEISETEEKEEKAKEKKPKKKPVELSEIEDAEKYVPEVPDKIEFEKPIKEQPETPAVPWRRETKKKPEQPEDEKVPLKIGKGKLPEEIDENEEVKLKPVKKGERIPIEKVEKTKQPQIPDSVFKPKEYEKLEVTVPGKDEEKPTEIIEMIPKLIPEEKLMEKKPQPEEVAPWRRQQKKPKEKEEEVKEWPRGQRKPLPEEEKEEIKLKPISKEKPEKPIHEIETEEIKPQLAEAIDIKKHDDTLQLSPTSPEEIVEETVTITKREKKKKPKRKPSEDTTPEELPVAENLEEIKPRPEEEEPLKPEEEISKVSETEIVLIKRKPKEEEEIKPREVPEEETKEIGQDETVQQGMNIQVVSKKVVREKKKVVSFDDDQPIKELEIISQKRQTEVQDKLPEEIIREEIEGHEQKIVQKSVIIKGIREKAKIIAPKFTKRVEPVVAEEGKPTRLICTVEGTPFPEVVWYKNEEIFHATERVYVNIVENTVTLEFTKVEPQDVAIYSCRASNPAGVATSTANLVILGIYRVLCVSASFKLFSFS